LVDFKAVFVDCCRNSTLETLTFNLNQLLPMSNPFNRGRRPWVAGFLLLVVVHFICLTGRAQSNVTTSSAMSTNKALFDAIRSGSSDKLKNALANGSDANDSTMGYTALMAAALNGTADQMMILINHGARVNDTTGSGITALWVALPDIDKMTALLNHGADIYHKIDGYGILTKLAAIPGTINIFQFLISKGADPLNSCPDNLLLFNAAASGDTSLVGFLLRLGLKVNDTTAFGETPLNATLSFRTPSTLKMLVEHGANINFQNLHEPNLPAMIGFTPLMNAAVVNDKESLLFLLDHGADPNLRSKNGMTALILLQQSESVDPEMTMALINHGARVADKTPDGTDALYYAKEKGNTATVELLQKYLQK
jgi:ankyrin repeat protein